MATELGKAYVQIVPSARGISGAIESELGGGGVASAATGVGSKIGTLIKGAIATAGIGAALKTAISEGAELEQSIGGIETLFGTNGKTIEQFAQNMGKSVSEVREEYNMLEQAQALALDNASKAYATAGLSANDYMQTVTSFAAALKSSGISELEAAKAADAAVIAMSDNANKMGTDMASIQNAYQGFAKQNYSMLDNLKLGYGGSATEMERLIQDASALSGIKYDINNLADVYQAINVIQDELGITGTTAAEASKTISGSAAAMKASFKNLLGYLATGQDASGAMEQLVTSAVTFLQGNLIPAIFNVAKGIPKALTAGIKASMGMLSSAMGGGDIASIGQNLITAINSGMQNATGFLDTATTFVQGLSDGINAGLPNLLNQGLTIVNGIRDGILANLPGLISSGADFVSTIINGIAQAAPMVMTAANDMVISMKTGLIAAAPSIIEGAGQVLTSLTGAFLSYIPVALENGMKLIGSLAQGLISNLPAIVGSVAKVLAGFLATVTSHLPQILQKGIELIGKLAAGIIMAIPELVGKIPQIIQSIVNAFGQYDWGSIGMNIIKGIANGLRNAVGFLIDAAKEAAGKALEGAKNFLGISSPSKVFEEEVGMEIPPGIARGILKNSGVLDQAIKKMNMDALAAANIGGAYDVTATGTRTDALEQRLDAVLMLLAQYLPGCAEKVTIDGDSLMESINQQLGLATM